MKLFHISDVLSVTTGRLVSTRHMDGVYDVLDFLTGDSLFTHQLPRASREYEPWLRTQFPQLMHDSPGMAEREARLAEDIGNANHNKQEIERICNAWWEEIRQAHGLPEMLPLYEMGADMHTHIDPIEEAEAMVGKQNVIVVEEK
jgi:hypothetical protein